MRARMMEQADMMVSNTIAREGVRVRVPLRAPLTPGADEGVHTGQNPVGPPPSVRLHETAKQQVRMAVKGDVALPRLEHDGPQCFGPRPCWGKRQIQCLEWE